MPGVTAPVDYVSELRQLSRSCREAAHDTADQDAKRRFASVALSLALLAEKLALETNTTECAAPD
jgi:hypothetical protein